MHARGRLVIVVLLSLILAPWIGAMNPISESDESEHSTPFSELNEAQIDAILSAGAKGVTSWVKQGTANPNAQKKKQKATFSTLLPSTTGSFVRAFFGPCTLRAARWKLVGASWSPHKAFRAAL